MKSPGEQNGLKLSSGTGQLQKGQTAPSRKILKSLKNPVSDLQVIVYNKKRADILAQIAVIALQLKRAFDFIARISTLFILYALSKDPAIAEKLQPHYVPKSILALIQRE